MRRNYTVVDLLRFARLSKERAEVKPIDLIKEYDKDYPELTAKQKYENLLKALGMEKATELERVLAERSNEHSGLNKPVVNHCACSVDETTGWTMVKCCNICGNPLKDQNWHCG